MKKSDVDNGKYQIFISYTSKDRGVVRLMSRLLEREFGAGKIRAFFDDKYIEAGDSIPDEIWNEIRKCHEFLVLLTSDSLKSSWVVAEVGAACSHKKRVIGFKFKLDKENPLPMLYNKPLLNLDEFESKYLPALAVRLKEKRKKEGRKYETRKR